MDSLSPLLPPAAPDNDNTASTPAAPISVAHQAQRALLQLKDALQQRDAQFAAAQGRISDLESDYEALQQTLAEVGAEKDTLAEQVGSVAQLQHALAERSTELDTARTQLVRSCQMLDQLVSPLNSFSCI